MVASTKDGVEIDRLARELYEAMKIGDPEAFMTDFNDGSWVTIDAPFSGKHIIAMGYDPAPRFGEAIGKARALIKAGKAVRPVYRIHQRGCLSRRLEDPRPRRRADPQSADARRLRAARGARLPRRPRHRRHGAAGAQGRRPGAAGRDGGRGMRHLAETRQAGLTGGVGIQPVMQRDRLAAAKTQRDQDGGEHRWPPVTNPANPPRAGA